ncbi:MAG TPA: hypothetical protein VF712_02660 [Thermoleophilaceae bacterium]|jgi:hypothetical protein
MPHSPRNRRTGLRVPPRLAVSLATSLCLLATTAGPAHAAWNQPVGGPSPINQTTDRDAQAPKLTAIGGVPHLAWIETDGTPVGSRELRVSRLNAGGTGWEPVGTNPIDHAPNHDAVHVSLAGIGGVPHVAWVETDDQRGNFEVRVSRLNGAGTAWEEVVGGTSPINHSSSFSAIQPSLTAVGGVPYVAWVEFDGTNWETRASRLNAAGTAWEEVVGGASPINHSNGATAICPSLTAIGGVPHVAWVEFDGDNFELRVSRLNGAGTAWEEVVGGASPINHSSDRDASCPSLTAVGGVPYVARAEFPDGDGGDVRVSRLNAAGTAWEEVVGGASPINHSNGFSASNPSLAAIGGAPYVAWREDDGTNAETRVSRLNAAGTAWEEVVGGASPINQSSDRHAEWPGLTGIGGVPYVAWSETDGTNYELRASRLEPEFLSQAAIATDAEAVLLSRVRTYGVAYPIAFQYGRGALDDRTPVTQTAYDEDADVVFQPIAGLTPASAYAWRTIGFDGVRPTGLAPTQAFTTSPAPASGTQEPGEPQRPVDLLVAVVNRRLEGLAGRSVTVRYFLSRKAEVTLEVRRCGGKVVATVPNRAGARARAGRNKITWNGRIRGRRPRAGCYILAVRATSSDGQNASDRAKLRLTARRTSASN